MEMIFKNMRGIVALVITVGCFTFLFMLLYKGIPISNKELLYTAAGVILAKLSDVSNYLFGGSKDKTDAEKAARAADPNVNSEISPPKKSKTV